MFVLHLFNLELVSPFLVFFPIIYLKHRATLIILSLFKPLNYFSSCSSYLWHVLWSFHIYCWCLWNIGLPWEILLTTYRSDICCIYKIAIRIPLSSCYIIIHIYQIILYHLHHFSKDTTPLWVRTSSEIFPFPVSRLLSMEMNNFINTVPPNKPLPTPSTKASPAVQVGSELMPPNQYPWSWGDIRLT